MPSRKPATYDLAAGEYRVLGDPFVLRQPADELRHAAGEWYEKTVFSRRTQTQRVTGKKCPKVVSETHEYRVTVGLAIGAGALLFAWETGQAIAHGLAGLNPLNWAADISAYIEGKPQANNIAQNSVGGFIEANIMAVLAPVDTVPPPPSTPPSSSAPPVAGSGSGSGGSTSGSSSAPPNPYDPGPNMYCPSGTVPAQDPFTGNWGCVPVTLPVTGPVV